MKQILKPFDYIFVLKPVMFFPVWVLFLAGYYVQNNLIAPYHYANGMSPNISVLDESKLILIGLTVALLMGAIFVLTQVMSRKSETKDALTLIAPGKLTPKAAFIESAVLSIGAVVYSFFFSWKIGLLAFVILFIFGYFYNFSPFSFKDNPLLGLITKFVIVALLFGVGWTVNGSLNSSTALPLIPYLCFFLGLLLFEAVDVSPNSNPDKKTTFAEKFGFSTTLYIATVLIASAIAVAYNFKDELIFYPALFAFPFFLWAAISSKNSEVERALKYTIVFLVITIAFKWGLVFKDYLFIITVAVIYFGAKIYYRLRFGVNHPTLAVEIEKER